MSMQTKSGKWNVKIVEMRNGKARWILYKSKDDRITYHRGSKTWSESESEDFLRNVYFKDKVIPEESTLADLLMLYAGEENRKRKSSSS